MRNLVPQCVALEPGVILESPTELKNRYFDQLAEKVKQFTSSRRHFNNNVRIANEHTGKRAVETSDGLRLALATPAPIAGMILDGRLNYERSSFQETRIVLEGKFINFEYVDVIAAASRIESFAARLVIMEIKQGKKSFLVVSFHPDRQNELDFELLPEVRHDPWN